MGLKVLFIVKDLEGAEPLGALYVAGALEAAGHVTRFIGTRAVSIDAELRRFAPDVVALSATTGLHRFYAGLAAHVKQVRPDAFVLLGGPHATHFPQILQSPGFDAICRGEGEDVALELVGALERGEELRGLPGTWVKREGRIFRAPAAALRRDLDSLPFPPRQRLYEWDDALRARPLKSFTANRGCPFPCTYCFNESLASLYGPGWKRVRVRSPANVVDEIVEVRRSGPLDIVGFRESIFAYTPQWLRDFGARYRSEVGLPFYCHVRADLLDEELVELLVHAGCHSVNVGIETASAQVAEQVLGRGPRHEAMKAGVRLLKRAGIVVFADNMVGLPGGSFADDLETLRLNIELDVDYAAATLCTPYPGTELARYAVAHGYFDGDFDAVDESYYGASALAFAPREKRRIENLHKLFALTAAVPALLPLVERLVELPPNDFFYAAFRAFYVISHLTEVMPRRADRQTLTEALLGIFGVYRGRQRRYPAPAPEALPFEDCPARGAPPCPSA